MIHQYCSFTLGEQLYGVDIDEVQEVLSAQPMTPVPLAPTAVRGLINLRGEIVPAIDLRVRLGLAERGSERSAGEVSAPELSNVVLRTSEGAISLLVDGISDVLSLADDALEPAPAGAAGGVPISSRARALLTGVHQLASGLLLVLDPSAVIDLREHEPTPDSGLRPIQSSPPTAARAAETSVDS